MAFSEDLVKEYRRLDGLITRVRPEQPEAIPEDWKREIYRVGNQFRLGSRVALRDVKKVLGADPGGENADVPDGDDHIFVEGSPETVHGPLSYNLCRSLRDTEKGVRWMLKGLPSKEL